MTPHDQTQMRESAPHNNLPSWDECDFRVANSKFIEQRIAEGGYGAEPDTKLASQLHRFIHEYDDSDPYRSSWFLHRLELVLIEERQEAEKQALEAQAAPDFDRIAELETENSKLRIIAERGAAHQALAAQAAPTERALQFIADEFTTGRLVHIFKLLGIENLIQNNDPRALFHNLHHTFGVIGRAIRNKQQQETKNK